MLFLLVCKFFGPKIRSCNFFDKSQVWCVAQSVEQSVAHEGTLERLLQAPGRQWAHTWGAERGDFKSGQGSARSGFKSIAPECESGGNLWGRGLWLIDWLGPITGYHCLPVQALNSKQTLEEIFIHSIFNYFSDAKHNLGEIIKEHRTKQWQLMAETMDKALGVESGEPASAPFTNKRIVYRNLHVFWSLC